MKIRMKTPINVGKWEPGPVSIWKAQIVPLFGPHGRPVRPVVGPGLWTVYYFNNIFKKLKKSWNFLKDLLFIIFIMDSVPGPVIMGPVWAQLRPWAEPKSPGFLSNSNFKNFDVNKIKQKLQREIFIIPIYYQIIFC